MMGCYESLNSLSYKVNPDLLKVFFFARLKFTSKNFAQSYALKLVKKHRRFEKTLSNFAKNMKKVTALKVQR